ncbi:helix-turn-helix domain-containing protein [Embleya sp. NPDC050493]|uniref:helix-turn-helix domain-containing protein n=1 Tax=Embleya sp. NPDC050493 TaxID=3363989 RepID=UPI00379292B4
MECVRLLARRMTVPEVADLVECHQVTVREAVHRFHEGGFEALGDARRPGRPPGITREDLDALGALPDASAQEGRTWAAAAPADWPAVERQVAVSPPG